MTGPDADRLRAALGPALAAEVVALTPVPGGDINDAYRVGLADGRTVFAKARAGVPADFFAAEADGLARLAATGTVTVPVVVAVDPAFLVLEWIEPGRPAATHDETLGRALADLHRAPCAGFGLERSNYIGTVPQDNGPAPTWPAFFAERRLRPLVAAALARGALPGGAKTIEPLLERVIDRLDERCGPPEPPSLLHGDLWGGNAMVGADGLPVLIDPAVHGGHREIDLAMMRLFGGFSARVFAAYQEAAPLADGHEERVRLYQLPPLLVHAVLFGGGYGTTVVNVLRRYA